jgi:hypothetical protein
LPLLAFIAFKITAKKEEFLPFLAVILNASKGKKLENSVSTIVIDQTRPKGGNIQQ